MEALKEEGSENGTEEFAKLKKKFKKIQKELTLKESILEEKESEIQK